MAFFENSKELYKKAEEYLAKITPKDFGLEKYYKPSHYKKEGESLGYIYERFLISAQNRRYWSTSIKFVENKDAIKKILRDFDVKQIADMKLEDIQEQFESSSLKHKNKDGKITNHVVWNKFARSALETAQYLNKNFKCADEFRNCVESKIDDCESRIEFIKSLEKEHIYGLKFALLCDAMKELGYENFSKPDNQMIGLLFALGFTKSEEQIETFRAMDKIASDCGVTPFKLDRMLWLCCTQDFFLDKTKLSNREKFIAHCAR